MQSSAESKINVCMIYAYVYILQYKIHSLCIYPHTVYNTLNILPWYTL